MFFVRTLILEKHYSGDDELIIKAFPNIRLVRYYYSHSRRGCMYMVKNGKKHGKQTTFNRDGNILYKCNWIDGKRHGKETVFYSDGTIFSECDWINDKKHRKEKKFYLDGSVRWEIDWIDDKKHGTSRLFIKNTKTTF